MKHLVVGGSGQVGSALIDALVRREQTVVGTYLSHPVVGQVPLDMRQSDAIRKIVQEIQPDVIWVPGALPDVDRCEVEPDLSEAVNVRGPIALGDLAASREIPLVYFSSDYVFDGENGPYRETDPTHPIQVYGQHKVKAEEALLQYENTLVIRPAWIYSQEPNPRNFVYRIASELQKGHTVKAADDQYNTPTPSTGLAVRAVDAWLGGYRGILHLVGPERLSRLELVARIAQILGYDHPNIEVVHVGDLALPAKRPLNGGLITNASQFAIDERLEDLDFRQILTGH